MNYETAFPLLNEYRSKYRPDMANGVCYEGDDFLASLSARDPEKQEVSYFLTGGALPMGAFVDPSQGTVSGTLLLKHFDTGEQLMGDHTWYFTIGAFDGVNTRHQDFSITVKHINTPPTWAANSFGPILEMYEGNTIAQATVFEAFTLIGTYGNAVIYANNVPICNSVNFSGSLENTAQSIVAAINSHNSESGPFPDYSGNYISGSTFKVVPTGANITLTSSGNLLLQKSTGANSVVAVDEFGNEAVGNNIVGYKILGAIDPEFEFNPESVETELTYRAVGPLFDRPPTANAIVGSTIIMQANGVMIGALPPRDNTGGIVGKEGGSFPMDVYVNDGEYDVARGFSIFVKNVNSPPVWQTPPEDTELGPVTEGTPISPITLTAIDVDQDALTYSISNVTVGNGVATTLANVGLSVATVNNVAVLTGTPSNAAVPPEENIANTVWYLANPNGTSISPAGASYYGIVDDKTVFRSKPYESPFVTVDGAVNNPAIGSRYVIQYSIRKIQNPTNGVIGYVRPAFDGFQSGNPQPTVLGQRSGFGYVSDINNVGYDFFDTSLWTLNTWYLIRAEYTVNTSFSAIRGRIRMNRSAFNAGGPPYFNGSGYINRTDGPPYSDAIFEMRGYSISKNDNQTYRFTANVSDGEYTRARNYIITVGNKNLPPVWDTASGTLGSSYSNAPFNKQLAAHDPEGNPVTYSQVGGSLPPGLTLGSTGVISGTLGVVVSDTTYSFTVRASDGTLTVDRGFSITVLMAVNAPPVWQTPSGTIVSSPGGSSVSYQLVAVDPEGDPVTYTLTSGSLPPGVSMSPSGALSGSLPAVGANTDYNFEVTASSGSPVQTTPRSFTITATFAAVPGSIEYGPGDYNFTVPAGIFSVTITHMLAGGGGGGAGTQIASGGGGGGGGSGGYSAGITVPCSPGQNIQVHVGAAGVGQLPPGNSTNYALGNGTNGDATIITHGGDVYTVTGGVGGSACPNVVKNQHANAPGGPGGSPGGNPGGDGPGGASDYSSMPGGAGASSPLGAGGAGGNGGPGTNGGNATGYGAGGGGGGSYDRSGPGWWIGGSGSPGFVRLDW